MLGASTAVIFVLIFLSPAVAVVYCLFRVFASHSVPTWACLAAAVIAGGLVVWAFTLELLTPVGRNKAYDQRRGFRAGGDPPSRE